MRIRGLFVGRAPGTPKWTDVVGFVLIFLGVAVSMVGPGFFQGIPK